MSEHHPIRFSFDAAQTGMQSCLPNQVQAAPVVLFIPSGIDGRCCAVPFVLSVLPVGQLRVRYHLTTMCSQLIQLFLAIPVDQLAPQELQYIPSHCKDNPALTGKGDPVVHSSHNQ